MQAHCAPPPPPFSAVFSFPVVTWLSTEQRHAAVSEKYITAVNENTANSDACRLFSTVAKPSTCTKTRKSMKRELCPGTSSKRNEERRN